LVTFAQYVQEYKKGTSHNYQMINFLLVKLRVITLHCITLRYITLYYITYCSHSAIFEVSGYKRTMAI